MRTVRYATPPEPSLSLDLAPRPRAHAPLPVFNPGSFIATQAGFDEATARGEASRCFRCDAVYGCATVSVRAGRGPADRPRPHRDRPAARPPGGAHVRCTRRRPGMTPEQVTGFFDAGEAFVEGTIGAALVVLWLVALGLHLARPYMAHTTGKFTLRLGADLWWIIYVALRDIFLLQVFLGSFIFFYPDVVTGQALPVHGRAGGGLRLRGAAHQADHEGRR